MAWGQIRDRWGRAADEPGERGLMGRSADDVSSIVSRVRAPPMAASVAGEGKPGQGRWKPELSRRLALTCGIVRRRGGRC